MTVTRSRISSKVIALPTPGSDCMRPGRMWSTPRRHSLVLDLALAFNDLGECWRASLLAEANPAPAYQPGPGATGILGSTAREADHERTRPSAAVRCPGGRRP